MELALQSPAAQRAFDFGCYYQLPFMKQPTSHGCWAAAFAMMTQIGEHPMTPEHVAKRYGEYAEGLPLHTKFPFGNGLFVDASHFRRVLRDLALTMAEFRRYGARELWELLVRKGPLIIVHNDGHPIWWEMDIGRMPPSQLMVVTGMGGAKSDFAGAELVVHDPWRLSPQKIPFKGLQAKLVHFATRLNVNGYFIGHYPSLPVGLK